MENRVKLEPKANKVDKVRFPQYEILDKVRFPQYKDLK